MLNLVRILLVILALLAAAQARAQLEIIVTDPGAQRSPIAIVPFAGENEVGTTLTAIVREPAWGPFFE